MKRLSALLCLCFCFNFLGAQEVLNCPLTLPHQNDFQNYWDLKAEIGEENERILDWAPPSEELGKSTESFTIQTYQLEDNFDLRAMYDKFLSTLKENINPPELLHTKVHSKNRKAIFFEWWVNSPHKEAQHEWIKLMRNNKNQFAIVRFVTKKELTDQEKELWVQCVAEAKFDLNQQANFLDIEKKVESQ